MKEMSNGTSTQGVNFFPGCGCTANIVPQCDCTINFQSCAS